MTSRPKLVRARGSARHDAGAGGRDLRDLRHAPPSPGSSPSRRSPTVTQSGLPTANGCAWCRSTRPSRLRSVTAARRHACWPACSRPGRRSSWRADPALDRVDRYGRLLRYVVKGSVNVNIALVSRGAATVWFFDGDQGPTRVQAARGGQDREAGREGPLGCLSGHALRPAERGRHRAGGRLRAARPAGTESTTTGTARRTIRPTTAARALATRRRGTARRSCDPAYPTVCIPPPPPDLDCGDVNQKRFTVLPPDPHRFDGDHDGIGCES